MSPDKYIDDRGLYWDEFYSSTNFGVPLNPSGFALAIGSIVHMPSLIYDFGCGNGRDAMYFAAQGHSVVAVDGCSVAIDELHNSATEHGLTNLECVAAKIDDQSTAAQIIRALKRPSSNYPAHTIVYARFFLHAITENEQEIFLNLAKELLSASDQLAVEFRTNQDRAGTKTTPPHYRRYIAPSELIRDAALHDLRPLHFQQGRGLAVHGVDDAHVARIVFVRNDPHSRRAD